VYSFDENVLSDYSPLRASQNFIFCFVERWNRSTKQNETLCTLRSSAVDTLRSGQ